MASMRNSVGLDGSSELAAKCDRFPKASRSALCALCLHRAWRHHGRHNLEQPARRFAQLETRLDKKLTIHDEAIAAILSAIRQLMHPPVPKRRPIGFTANLREKV